MVLKFVCNLDALEQMVSTGSGNRGFTETPIVGHFLKLIIEQSSAIISLIRKSNNVGCNLHVFFSCMREEGLDNW